MTTGQADRLPALNEGVSKVNANTVNMKILVCALIAMAPNALLVHALNVTTRQAQTIGQTSPTSEQVVDSSTAPAVLVD
jgi:hypothetical protein